MIQEVLEIRMSNHHMCKQGCVSTCYHQVVPHLGVTFDYSDSAPGSVWSGGQHQVSLCVKHFNHCYRPESCHFLLSKTTFVQCKWAPLVSRWVRNTVPLGVPGLLRPQSPYCQILYCKWSSQCQILPSHQHGHSKQAMSLLTVCCLGYLHLLIMGQYKNVSNIFQCI